MADLPNPTSSASNTRIAAEELRDARNGLTSLTTNGDSGHVTRNGDSLGSGASLSDELNQPGATELVGRVVRATTSYDVDLEVLDGPGGNVLFTKSIAAGVAGGTETSINETVESPHVNVVVSDAGAGSGAVTETLYLR